MHSKIIGFLAIIIILYIMVFLAISQKNMDFLFDLSIVSGVIIIISPFVWKFVADNDSNIRKGFWLRSVFHLTQKNRLSLFSLMLFSLFIVLVVSGVLLRMHSPIIASFFLIVGVLFLLATLCSLVYSAFFVKKN